MLSSLGQKERRGCWEKVFASSEPYIICVCFSQLLFQALLNHARGIKVSERLQRKLDDSKVILLCMDL